jgi:hypothetical protein
MSVAKVPRYKKTRIWEKLRGSWLGEAVRGYRGLKRELLAWWRCPDVAMPSVGQLSESLAILQPGLFQETAGQDNEAPIFLLSTGWRAGSTLLQRILITDPRLLLWGEPLGEMTIVSKIAEMVSHFISPRNLQLWKDQPDPSSPALSTSWVANLYPEANDFRLALRRFLDQWLREPAWQRGFSRWGFKEVRFGATEASLLHWLYPNAKFVIISRHPYDCYQSLASWDQEVYHRYPDVRVDTAAGFAKQWNCLALSWSQLPAALPCVHLKYEDLIAGRVNFRELESWLDIEIKENVALSTSVGATAKGGRLSWYERMIIAREASEGMRALGYEK